MKLSFLLKLWYDLSLDLSFDPKAMAAIKLGVVPRYSIWALGERDEDESDIPVILS